MKNGRFDSWRKIEEALLCATCQREDECRIPAFPSKDEGCHAYVPPPPPPPPKRIVYETFPWREFFKVLAVAVACGVVLGIILKVTL